MPELDSEPLTNLPEQRRREGPTSTHPSGAAPGRFACVVDDHPRFHLDALRWYAALTALAGVNPSDLVVHAVGGRSSEILGFLGSQGVNIRSVERFDARSPHCNKISGALRLADDPIEGMAVLCDTDVVVCEDPRQLTLQPGTVAGKLVDAPVPALEVVLSIFLAAGLKAPPTVPLPWGPDDWTVSGNSNGGLYLVPGALLPRLATAWAHWAVWLLDRAELLQEWTVYVDQVAMALALAAEGVGSLALDVRWNTPTHDPSRIPPDAPEPKVLHYHQEIDLQGLIRGTGIASIDRRIGEVNGAIRAVWKQAAPDATHRHWLSMSGAGSWHPIRQRRQEEDCCRSSRDAQAGIGTRGRHCAERGVRRLDNRAARWYRHIRGCSSASANRTTRLPVRCRDAGQPQHRSRYRSVPGPADPCDECRRVPGSD